MSEIERRLQEEIEKLENARSEILERQQDAPPGRLRIANCGGRIQYFHATKVGDTQGIYIPKSKTDLARQLAQKAYERRLLEPLEQQIQVLEKCRKDYSEENLPGVYQQLNSYRKELVEPLFISDEEYAAQWMRVEYEGKGFAEDDPTDYYTEKDERVRSKTEILIADTFKHSGIPYRYECPLTLEGRAPIYVDFTLLNPHTREVKYWEHFGCMDDEAYRQEVYWKLSNYAEHGIVQGKNLYLSFEGKPGTLNVRVIRKMIAALADEMGI